MCDDIWGPGHGDDPDDSAADEAISIIESSGDDSDDD